MAKHMDLTLFKPVMTPNGKGLVIGRQVSIDGEELGIIVAHRPGYVTTDPVSIGWVGGPSFNALYQRGDLSEIKKGE